MVCPRVPTWNHALAEIAEGVTIEYTSKSSLIAQVAGNATMGPTFRNECGGVETPAKDYEPRKPRKRPKEMSHFNFLGIGKS